MYHQQYQYPIPSYHQYQVNQYQYQQPPAPPLPSPTISNQSLGQQWNHGQYQQQQQIQWNPNYNHQPRSIPHHQPQQNYNFHITKVDNRPIMNSIKLPSISNFSNFKKPIVFKPLPINPNHINNVNHIYSLSPTSSISSLTRSSSLTSISSFSSNSSSNPSSNPSSRSSSLSSPINNKSSKIHKKSNEPKKDQLTIQQKIAIENKIIQELKQELLEKATKTAKSPPPPKFKINSNHEYYSDMLIFKPKHSFLQKIKVDDLFVSKYVFQDLEISPLLNPNATKVQKLSINKNKVLEYKIYEFFYKISKFNDKTSEIESSKLINNFPSNHIYLTIKFDLFDCDLNNDFLIHDLKNIIINLKLLKTSNSKIDSIKIKFELLKIFNKFMPQDESIQFNYQTNRPCWRLGAKDELNILEMDIKFEY
ncbi:Immunoglobulin superfamily member [Wickerhamomyces ciferrii]|uniref:Immunoglobulin superfamily member n=1 Tax=Wickerhamomyces ciferrii (strain ATCC 14091 / BCRC 22168 / CBS 111 / JCM 3599 / NBRC 0793 / NRRL Y-1031 F-60-10) TaxID=1206466 RepID=K0KPT9_WICCF|nr:Immunoglobulin superfamily member [Wickerhamomyces ciferrii]CCH43429.1 Immunoglobulin superfamily member [Wickerhamomyces ciferrii]